MIPVLHTDPKPPSKFATILKAPFMLVATVIAVIIAAVIVLCEAIIYRKLD